MNEKRYMDKEINWNEKKKGKKIERIENKESRKGDIKVKSKT